PPLVSSGWRVFVGGHYLPANTANSERVRERVFVRHRAGMKAFTISGTITDETFTEYKKTLPQDLRIDQYNEFASYDTIRHYAHGIGDDNPLWCDEAYGKSSMHGTMLAPPTFLNSIFTASINHGLPEIGRASCRES